MRTDRIVKRAALKTKLSQLQHLARTSEAFRKAERIIESAYKEGFAAGRQVGLAEAMSPNKQVVNKDADAGNENHNSNLEE